MKAEEYLASKTVALPTVGGVAEFVSHEDAIKALKMARDSVVTLNSEQAYVILLALKKSQTFIHEGGNTGIRNERDERFVENLIYYIKSRTQDGKSLTI